MRERAVGRAIATAAVLIIVGVVLITAYFLPARAPDVPRTLDDPPAQPLPASTRRSEALPRDSGRRVFPLGRQPAPERLSQETAFLDRLAKIDSFDEKTAILQTRLEESQRDVYERLAGSDAALLAALVKNYDRMELALDALFEVDPENVLKIETIVKTFRHEEARLLKERQIEADWAFVESLSAQLRELKLEETP